VTASSTSQGYQLMFAVDMNDRNGFGSDDASDRWLCYDFRTLRIIPTGYSILSWSVNWADTCYLRSWVIETSIDGQAWSEVDRRSTGSNLKGGSVQSFTIANGQECRFIRIRQTGNTEGGWNHLLVSSWEIFGSLIASNSE
jgi:hypothetical protein